MNDAATKVKMFFADPLLRKRILFTAFALIAFRFLSAIPIPGIDQTALANLFNRFEFLGLLNVFSGSGLANFSIVMLGVGPYITATIIMQLLTLMSPRLKAMYHDEGDAGRKRFSQYSRLITLPLALVQSFSFLTLLERQGVIADLPLTGTIINMLIVTAGALLLMWLGELMTEFGFTNGTSLIIFAGIVSSLPSAVVQFALTFDAASLPKYLLFLAIAIVIILGVVVVTEAERPLPVTYAKRVRGMKVYGGVSTYLPLRVNQAGVIPIIFALSILLFPQIILSALGNVDQPTVRSIALTLSTILQGGWIYSIIYFVLVFLFTYFYTAVTFDPEAIANNLQKSGAFIPGVRPGQATSEYVARVVTRITLVGALFLGIIAVLPLVMQSVTGNATLAIGGTALLIVVSVVLDITKKLQAQIAMREY